MIRYDKLVRDGIPGIILAQNETPHTRVLSDAEYGAALLKKLHEEADEAASGDIEELADALEVLHALAEHMGYAWQDVENARVRKKEKRGGFSGKVFLIGKE